MSYPTPGTLPTHEERDSASAAANAGSYSGVTDSDCEDTNDDNEHCETNVLEELAVVEAVNKLEEDLCVLFDAPHTQIILHSLDTISSERRPPCTHPEQLDTAIHEVGIAIGHLNVQTSMVLNAYCTPIFCWIARALRTRAASVVRGTYGRLANIVAVFFWTHITEVRRCLDVAECLCHMPHVVTVRGKRSVEIDILRKHLDSLATEFHSFDVKTRT